MVIEQVEIEQAVDAQRERMAAWIEGEYDYARPRRREMRQATIVAVDEEEVVVDLGGKRDGIVPSKDLDRLKDEYRDSLQVGDQVAVYILDTSQRHDGIIVSLNKGLAYQDWLRAERMLDSEEGCEAEVTDVNRGGVVVRFGRLRGFVPNSHLTAIRRGWSEERRQETKSALVGQTLSLVVIEVNRKRRRLVLSQRVASRRNREQLLEELSVGEVREGVVRSIVDFGAFVDLGGIDGLIHISELDWKHVNHPSEILSEGDQVQVYVLKIERERERIGLSRKQLLPDPWPIVTEDLQEGQIIAGTVTKVVSFGAFVDVGEGVEGLVHVSEMPDGEETRRSLEPGTPVQAQVLKIDPWRHRISLSTRLAGAIPEVVPTETAVMEVVSEEVV